jgi:hypothetical protein
MQYHHDYGNDNHHYDDMPWFELYLAAVFVKIPYKASHRLGHGYLVLCHGVKGNKGKERDKPPSVQLKDTSCVSDSCSSHSTMRNLSLHKPGLAVSSSPMETSTGYLSSVTRTVAASSHSIGSAVSVQLPPIAGPHFREWHSLIKTSLKMFSCSCGWTFLSILIKKDPVVKPHSLR